MRLRLANCRIGKIRDIFKRWPPHSPKTATLSMPLSGRKNSNRRRPAEVQRQKLHSSVTKRISRIARRNKKRRCEGNYYHRECPRARTQRKAASSRSDNGGLAQGAWRIGSNSPREGRQRWRGNGQHFCKSASIRARK